jgi:hypothetical protein
MKLLVEEREKELNEIKEKNDLFEKLAKEKEIKMKQEDEARQKKLLQDQLEEKTKIEMERRERERLSKLEEEHLKNLAQMVEEKQSTLIRVQSEFELAEKMKQEVEESIRLAEREGRQKLMKEEEERIISSLQAAIDSEEESLIQYALQEAVLTRIEGPVVEVAKKMIKAFDESRRIAEEKAEKKRRALEKAKARDDAQERLKFFGGPADSTDYGSPESSPKNKKGKKAKGGYPDIPNRVSTPTLRITPLKRASDDNSSVRAYPIDSRAAWVEQQHVKSHNFVVARDNLPIGPGDYSPKESGSLSRHISTPSLGHGAIGNFKPLDHPSVMRPGESLAQSSLTSHYGKEDKEQYSIVDDINLQKEKTEFRTVFHDFDRRQPLDPNRKFTKTPGSYLKPEPITDAVTINGKYKAPGFTFNSDYLPDYKYSRNNVQPALPIYDVNYDSKWCKPGVLLAKISTSERFPSPTQRKRDNDRSPSPDCKRFTDKQQNASIANSTILTSESILSQIKMPKLKSIDKIVMKFDASSYTNNKIKPEIVLCPSLIEKKIRKNAFMAMVTAKTEHKTKNLESKLNNRLKMNL